MIHRLDIKQLQMLVSIVARDGLTPAATEIGLTTSALSHRLREAERRLGFPLFERQGHILRLTPAGERVLRGAQEILDILGKTEQEAADIAAGFTASLKIGSRAYSCYRWLPRFLQSFQKKYPHIMVELLDGTISGPVEALRGRHIDVLILSGSPSYPGVTIYPLFEDELVGVIPPGHPATQKNWLEPQDFQDSMYLTYSTTPEPGMEYEKFFRAAGVTPRRMLKAGLTEAIIELVHHGYGMSILANWAVLPAVQQHYVATKPLTKDGLTVPWSAAARSDEAETSPAHVFANELARWCRREHAAIGYSVIRNA